MGSGTGVFMKVIIHSIYSDRVRSSKRFTQPSKTQKQFADECSTDRIVEKFLRGEPVAQASKPAIYADLTKIPDFEALQSRLSALNAWFADLPSSVRAEFDNDPQMALEELTKPGRLSDAVELGLLGEAVLQKVEELDDKRSEEVNDETFEKTTEATQDSQPQKNVSQA